MAHFIQPRRIDGRFQEIGGMNPPPLLELPASIAALYQQSATPSTSTALLDELLPEPVDEQTGTHDDIDLTPEEAARFAAAVESAMRDALTPASRAALDAERRVVEARFGSIDWNA